MQSTQCFCTVDDPKPVVPEPLLGYQIIENTTSNENRLWWCCKFYFLDVTSTRYAVSTRREPVTGLYLHSLHVRKSYLLPITKTKPNPNQNTDLYLTHLLKWRILLIIAVADFAVGLGGGGH